MVISCLRIKHCFSARHYRGHGIHSPFLYDFIRSVLMQCGSAKDLLQRIDDKYNVRPTVVCNMKDVENQKVVFLPNCHLDLDEFHTWRSLNPCLSVWLKWGVLIFFDRKLPNQHFNLRS